MNVHQITKDSVYFKEKNYLSLASVVAYNCVEITSDQLKL